MKKSLISSCLLLAACGGVQMEALPVETVTPLEQACLRDPADPHNWERLAAALSAAGERERAATMHLQAASLRRHDVRQDYVTVKQADSDMPRTQVRRIGPALVEVSRSGTAPVARLEISNGNGINGAAARLARVLERDGVQTVRLTNQRPFLVRQSRIEYHHAQREAAQMLGRRLNLPLQAQRGGQAGADMRIVLGRDLRYLK